MFPFDFFLQQTDLDGEVQPQPVSPSAAGTVATTVTPTPSGAGPKRLHVSNIPFRFREADLRNLLGVSLLEHFYAKPSVGYLRNEISHTCFF